MWIQSGKYVIAMLTIIAAAQPSAAHMRCQFRLAISDEGMKGGGLGQCQLPNRTTIDANLLLD